MNYLGIIIGFFTLMYGCSNFTPSANFQPTHSASNQFVSDAEYLEGRETFPTEISGKKDGIAVATKISFPVKVIDLNKEDLIVINGRIKEGSFSRIDDKNFAVIIVPIEFGDVTIQVPAEVVTAFVRNKKNDASEKLVINFSDVELDSTLKLADVEVTTVPTSEPTKLVMIIDNSDSRAGDQERLADNLRASLESLKDKNVEVFAYSTTLFDAKTLPFVQNPGVAGRYYGYNSMWMGGKGISGYYATSRVNVNGLFTYYGKHAQSALRSETTFIKNTSTGQQKTVVTKKKQVYSHDEIIEKYFLGPSLAPAEFKSSLGGVKFSILDSTSIQQNKLTAVRDMVSNFGEGGSNPERPLCTLAMSLSKDGPNKIFEQGDKVAFMIITDEDHPTTVHCPVSYSAKVQLKDFIGINPTINYLKYYIWWDKTVTTDGVSRTENVRADGSTIHDCYENGINTCHELMGGSSVKTRACNAAEESVQTNQSSITGPVTKCELKVVSGALGTTKFQVRNNQNYLPTATNFDVMLGGTVQTITNKTILQYLQDQQEQDKFWFLGGLQFDNSTGGFIESDRKIHTLAGVEEAGGLANLIKSKADSLLDNYSITAISNKGSNNAVCPSSIGISQEDFNAKESKEINKLADKSLSICQSDYTEIFDWFKDFVNKAANPEYQLDEKVRELVSVKLPGSDNALTPANYTFENGKLTFNNPSLLKFGNGEKFQIKYREE